MADFTITLQDLVEGGTDLDLRTYPIHDEYYRGRLNQVILDHYWHHEIGFRTKAEFVHHLNATMNEVMPLYSDYYKAAALIINPLQNQAATRHLDSTVDTDNSLHVAGTNTEDSTQRTLGDTTGSTSQTTAGETTATQTQDNLSVESDTPKSLLSVADIKSNLYASRASRQDNSQSGTGTNDETITGSSAQNIDQSVTVDSDGTSDQLSTGSGTITTDQTDTLAGYQGQSISSLVSEYHATLMNIDRMVLAELASCFMMVYSSDYSDASLAYIG